MFENVEAKIRKGSKKDPTKLAMKTSLPQIYNALHPSTTSMAIETRIQIASTKNTIKEWIQKNSNHINEQREVFKNILGKVQSLTEKINNSRKSNIRQTI
jgi:hypothetical protein